MTRSPSTRPVVILLSAQTLAFGVAVALLVVPALSIFLNTYGSERLPVSYIAVAVVGGATSWAMARAVRRFELVTVGVMVLGAQVVLFAASWAVLESGARWVAWPLLVAFPLALQIGFVFVGGQAGRLLNVRELKELFPKIVSGFVVGFFLGGLAGIPLLAIREQPQDLLLGAVAAQLAFVALLVATGRRFPAVRQPDGHDEAPAIDPAQPRVPLRNMLANRLVIVIFAYQVLSAMGSGLADFLMFDRAAARYPDEADLTRFLTGFTAIVNLVDVVVLVAVAGYLLRRFGLRYGLIANPLTVGLAFAGMLVVGVGPGVASLAFLSLSAITRILDIVLTDAATRTSINATYQVLPVDERVPVQTMIEGVGVPTAIGVTGVILLVLQALPGGTMVVVVVATIVALVWTVVAWMAMREYVAGLRRVVVERNLVDSPLDMADEREARALGQLLRSDDGRLVGVGLDLLAGLSSPATDTELRRLLDNDEPAVRLGALAELAGYGHLSALSASDAAMVIGALDGDGDLTSPTTLRAIGACRDLPPDIAVERLTPHIDHPDRAVGSVVLAALASSDVVQSSALAEQLRRVSAADATHVARILTAQRQLALDPSDPLARALADELDLLRARSVSMLVIRHGDVARQAVRAFSGTRAGGSQRALALETLEVIAQRDDALALAIVRPDLDDDARWQALGGVDSPAGPDASTAIIADMIDDPGDVWRSEWVAACATHHQDTIAMTPAHR